MEIWKKMWVGVFFSEHSVYRPRPRALKFGEMEFGETRRIGAIFACFYVARVWQRQLGFLVVHVRLFYRILSFYW